MILLALLLQAGDQKGEPQPEIWREMEVPAAPALSPEDALKSFRLHEGFRIELVAAEPLVEDPVAMTWDPAGRLYVVEMRGFMPDIDGRGEDAPAGRIAVLEDTDGDGVMDKRTTFLDQLVMPRAVALAGDGVLVAEPPNLWYCQDADGDLVSDVRTGVAHYGMQGPVEHTDNGLVRAIDNWIYNAKSRQRFQWRGGTLVKEETVARGQWGIAQDDFGRLYSNHNSSFLHAELVPFEWLARHPYYRDRHVGVNAPIVKDQRVYPIRVNPGVNRGYRRGVLRDDGTLRSTTATCGPTIYRGDAYPPEFRGNAFVPEPAANVVCRFSIEEEGLWLKGVHAHQDGDFVSSTDERFRPVNCYTGPDGNLYIVDLYRGILQHKVYVTTFLRKQVLERGLDKPVGLGRIYRVVREGGRGAPPPRLDGVEGLSHPNGFWRDTVQRLLVERGGDEAVGPLRALARDGADPLARIHAIWTLSGLGALDAASCLRAMEHSHPKVRIAAIRACGPLLEKHSDVVGQVVKLTRDEDLAVRVHALAAVSPQGGAEALAREGADPFVRQAVFSGLAGREVAFLKNLAWKEKSDNKALALSELARVIVASREAGAIASLMDHIAAHPDWIGAALVEGADATEKAFKPVKLAALPDSLPGRMARLVTWEGDPNAPAEARALTDAERARFERGRGLYTRACMTCHREDGRGFPAEAPTLVGTEWVLGPERRPAAIALQGMAGPLDVNGESWNLEMPPQESALTDEEIAAILTFVRRSWGNEADPVEAKTVAEMRGAGETRDRPWTAEELRKLD